MKDLVGDDSLVSDTSATLAPYAMHLEDSAGREYPEPEHVYRNAYQRDRDRIVHSSAFRRLAYKTQVFTGEMGDYHRTRLTHTLEVASIARTLARALRLNEDLVEALALVHDIGHPPFGHAGEEVLNQCASEIGGFNHNRQALRIVQQLESRYPDFPGLNLSFEIIEGQRHRAEKDPDNGFRPLLEVQLVDAADSIAYDAHDVDDAFHLGLIQSEQFAEIELWCVAAENVERRYGQLSEVHFRRAIVRALINLQASDLLEATQTRLAASGVASVAEVRSTEPLVVPTPDMLQQKRGLQTFLYERVYRHPQVLNQREQAQKMLVELFDIYSRNADLLPEQSHRADVTCDVTDHLASMTDRLVWEEYSRHATVPPSFVPHAP